MRPRHQESNGLGPSLFGFLDNLDQLHHSLLKTSRSSLDGIGSNYVAGDGIKKETFLSAADAPAITTKVSSFLSALYPSLEPGRILDLVKECVEDRVGEDEFRLEMQDLPKFPTPCPVIRI